MADNVTTKLGKDAASGRVMTDIGLIPGDWDLDSIQNRASITTGARNTQDRVDEGLYPFFVRSQTVERINSFSFDGEAVLTAGDGVGTGKIYHYINGKFDFHQRVYKISDFDRTLNGYFFYLYFSRNFYNRIMQMTAKSSVDSVRREMIADMKIPLPPAPEQEAIAEVSSDVDALILALDDLIEKKQNIKQGAMQQLLTGKKRLPGFTEEWTTTKLSEVLTVRHGKDQKAIERRDGAFPILATGGEIGRTDSLLYDKPSVLIGRKGTIDVPQYYDKPFWTIDTLFYTEISTAASPKYLFYLFNTIDWYRYNEASGVPSLSAATVESIEVKIPATKAEQDAIAEVLTDADAEIESFCSQREKLVAVKGGLMQELLTGKTRLI